MKRILGGTCALLLSLNLALNLAQAQKVAITQIVEHPSLDIIYKGIVDRLTDAGYTKETGLKINHQSAQGNPAIATQIAKKFVGDKPDVIVAIATPSAQAVVANTKSIPVLFSAVSNPVDAKLIKNINKPEANVTGVMDSPPIDAQLTLIQELVPNLKTIGIIYNPGESNSVTMVKDFIALAKAKNIQVIEGAAIKSSDVTTATRRLIGKVQAIYVPLDNTVISAFESVVKVSNDTKIPLFTADTDSVTRGAIASIGFDYYELGKQTGDMLIKIIKGTQVSDIPAENIKKLDLVINLKAAKIQGIVIPEALLKRAKKVLPE